MSMQFSSTLSTSDLLDKNSRGGQVIYCPQADLKNCNGYAVRACQSQKKSREEERSERLLYLRALANSDAYEVSWKSRAIRK